MWSFSDDAAIVGGLARLDGRSVVVIGHQKGRDTREKVRRNFGMPRPEGYRKALRLMRLAERFHLPLITLIDRSEEHTSELQSLMRISYAVFCLQTKKTHHP